MITGWVKSLISSLIPGGAERIGQGAQAFEKKARAKLIDIAEGTFLTEEVRKRSEKLQTLTQKGGEKVNGLALRLKARRRVKKDLADFYDTPEIVDEVTERIVEAAQYDSKLRRWFS